MGGRQSKRPLGQSTADISPAIDGRRRSMPSRAPLKKSPSATSILRVQRYPIAVRFQRQADGSDPRARRNVAAHRSQKKGTIGAKGHRSGTCTQMRASRASTAARRLRLPAASKNFLPRRALRISRTGAPTAGRRARAARVRAAEPAASGRCTRRRAASVEKRPSCPSFPGATNRFIAKTASNLGDSSFSNPRLRREHPIFAAATRSESGIIAEDDAGTAERLRS